MSDAAREAGRRYQDALDALSDQRKQIAEDLAFTDPSEPEQWDPLERRARETDPGGARPCLTFDQCGQYVANVAGAIEKAPPALHAVPASDEADKRVAEQLDGRFRHIEYASKAQQHYARALTSAARCGVGYLIVRPEYTDRAMGYQEARISSEGDPLNVVFDPWSVELGGSDATEGWLLRALSHLEFERTAGKNAPKVSFGDDQQKGINDERESILTAEEWRIVEQTRNMIFARDLARDALVALPEDEFWERQKAGEVVGERDSAGRENYKDKQRIVKWARMSGVQLIGEETTFPASGIGIVPVYGYVSFKNRRMRYCGIGRRARDAQRSYNWHMSEMRALQSQAAKAPYMIPERAFGGNAQYKALWDRASVESRAFLPYVDMDDHGPIAPPQRMQPAVNLQNHIQGALQAREDIQASVGMYAANIGKQSNAQSGVAYDAQKEQGEASTAHFPSHLSAALGQVGRLILDMEASLNDSARSLRTMSIDATPGAVSVNPEQGKALTEDPETGAVTINPRRGKYDARVIIGPAYVTQRAEGRDALNDVMTRNPALTPIVGPLWARTLDMPYADKLAQVMTAMAPDPVKAILQPDQAPSTEKLVGENAQLKQAMQEAVQVAQEAQAEIAELHAELEAAKAAADAKEDEVAIKAFDAQTKRLQVLGTTLTPEAVQQIAAQTALAALQQPLPGESPDGPGMDGTPQHEMTEAPQLEAMESAGDDMHEQPMQQPDPLAMVAGAIERLAAQQAEMAAALRKLTGPKRLIYDDAGEPVGVEHVDLEPQPDPEQMQEPQ